MAEARHIRLVLLGKTGTGKSSFAETMFGENVFEVNHTANPGTSNCQKVTRQVGDENITVIDSPGIFDNRMSDEDLRSQITDIIIESSEGIDAFLIFFRAEKFTKQENEVVSKIRNCFSEEAFRHSVVVFTHGDQLSGGMRIEEFFSGNQYLCDLLEKCGNRCCVVDNKYWNNNLQDEYRNNQIQVARLLQTVNDMVRREGRYTNEMLQEVKRMGKCTVLKMLAGIATGVLLGALLGVPRMIALVLLELRKSKTAALYGLPAASGVASGAAAASRVPLLVAAGVTAVAGAAVGGYIGYKEAKKAKSVKEAVKNTAEALIEPIKQAFERPNSTHET